jgi:hypothetical protein
MDDFHGCSVSEANDSLAEQWTVRANVGLLVAVAGDGSGRVNPDGQFTFGQWCSDWILHDLYVLSFE